MYPFRYAMWICVCVFFFISLNGFKNSRDELPRNDTRMYTYAQIITINEVDQNKSTLIELKLQNVHTFHSTKHSNSQQTNTHTCAHTRTHTHGKLFNLIRILSMSVKLRMKWNEMKKRISRIVAEPLPPPAALVAQRLAKKAVSELKKEKRICAISTRNIIYSWYL